MVKKYGDILRSVRQLLLPSEGEDAGFTALQLMCAETRKSSAQLVADACLYAAEELESCVLQKAERVRRGEPLAYVLGEWDFGGISLTVTPSVLIPREDTLAVAETARDAVSTVQSPAVLDLCTGSGCIGIWLAKELPSAKVMLGDVSRDALSVANGNIRRLKLGRRVCSAPLDVFEPAPGYLLNRFDLVTANPPYITDREMAELPDSVLRYEPELALRGGQDGLDCYRAIAKNYQSVLKPGGCLCLEFGIGQENDVCRILEENDLTVEIIKKDHHEIVRAVLARKGKEA